jgi:prevent-host-death family protein
MAKRVGARELKTRLGAYLARVKRGQALIVTERGLPIAELRPLPRAVRGAEAAVEEMIALGEATWSRREPLPAVRPATVRGEPVADTIAEEREDRA